MVDAAAGDASPDPADIEQIATAVLVSVGLLTRRLRQIQVPGQLTLPELSALTRLDRDGPATTTQLAKIEQISVQSMGATLGSLETRGVVERRPDPDDGRRWVLSVTDSGRQVLHERRSARARVLADGLAAHFDPGEMTQLMAAAPLLERLAQQL
jgi:DNA-binding MarR family transcriptional regulator